MSHRKRCIITSCTCLISSIIRWLSITNIQKNKFTFQLIYVLINTRSLCIIMIACSNCFCKWIKWWWRIRIPNCSIRNSSCIISIISRTCASWSWWSIGSITTSIIWWFCSINTFTIIA